MLSSMNPLMKTVAKYRIQMPPCETPLSAVTFSLPISNSPSAHRKVAKLLSLQVQNLARVQQVTQSYISMTYVIVYEARPLVSETTERLVLGRQGRRIDGQIQELMKSLVASGVRPRIHKDSFAIDTDRQLIFYLDPDFTELLDMDQDTATSIANECIKESQKMLRLRKEQSKGKRAGAISEIVQRVSEMKAEMGGLRSKAGQTNQYSLGRNEAEALKQRQHSSKKEPMSSQMDSIKTRRLDLDNNYALSESNHSTDSLQDQRSMSGLRNRITNALKKTEVTLNRYSSSRLKRI